MLTGEGGKSIATFTASNFLYKQIIGGGSESQAHYIKIALASFLSEYGVEGSLDRALSGMKLSPDMKVFLSQLLATSISFWVIEMASGNNPTLMSVGKEMVGTNVIDSLLKGVVKV